MKHVHSLMCGVTFAAALIGAYSQFGYVNNRVVSQEQKQRTITYHNTSATDPHFLLSGSEPFIDIDITENNAMHHYYATKTLLHLTSVDNLSLSDKDELKIIGSKETTGKAILYKLQQYYDGIPLSGRELIIAVDHRDDVEILTGQFEKNIQLTKKLVFEDQYAYRSVTKSERNN